MKLKVLLIPCVLLLGCSTSAPFQSAEHDFASFAVEQETASAERPTPERRPNIDKLVAAANKRYDRSRELEGILDEAGLKSLEGLPWASHPTLNAKRSMVRAAITEYDQARELEDLLSTYRALRKPGSNGLRRLSPHVESIRGDMADQRSEGAWQELRETLVQRIAAIFEKRAHVTYLQAATTVTSNHLKLLDEMIPVVRARTGTGGSRQADLLAIRSERSAVAARLLSLEAEKSAAAQDLAETANSASEPVFAIPHFVESMPSLKALVDVALKNAPGLKKVEANLERRRSGLRLANLLASEKPTMPGSSVREAIRREMRDRITSTEQTLRANQLSISTKVAQARARILGARAQEDSLKDRSVPDARKSLEDVRSSYSGRRASFLDAFRAARRLLNVELELAKTTHNKNIAEAAMLRALGRRTP